jgi:hypothetical protein
MPITLEEAQKNAPDAVDVNVIDEFRKSSDILNRITFDDSTSPVGGDTLVYSYRRLKTQRTAVFRPLNTEYPKGQVETEMKSVELKELGNGFEIDRVIAKLGPAASGAVQLNVDQLIKSIRAGFANSVINGDTANNPAGFDGLSKILTGSSTEWLPVENGVDSGYVDWTAINDKASALRAQSQIDEFLATMDDRPDALYGNRKMISLFKMIAAWTDQIDKSTDSFGRPVSAYDGIPLIDLGARDGSNDPVIEIVSRDTDGAGAGGLITGLSDLYAVRYGLNGFHAASVAGGSLVTAKLPDFSSAGAVKSGEVYLGPVAPVLKASKAAAVFRNIKVAS